MFNFASRQHHEVWALQFSFLHGLKDVVPPSAACLYGHINWSQAQAQQQSSIGLSQSFASKVNGKARPQTESISLCKRGLCQGLMVSLCLKRPHLESGTETYPGGKKCAVYSVFFFSRLACQILSLANKHSITLIPAYIPTHLNVEADYLSCGQLLLEWHLLPQYSSSRFSSLGPTRGGSAGILPYHSMPALLHLGNSTTSGGLELNAFNYPWTFSDKLYVSSFCISSSISVQVPGRTCWRSTHTSDSGGSMLDGGCLVSHSSQHVGRHASVLFLHKRSCHGL